MEAQDKSTIGWSTKENIQRPMLQAGENYIVSLPEGYLITGYTLVTQSTTVNNQDTFKYTTANGLVESEQQTTSNSTITVDGLSTNQIEIDLTEYNKFGTNGIMIWDITLNYTVAGMPYVSNAPSNGAWDANTTWYQIKTGSGHYFRSDVLDGTKLALTSTDASVTKASLWCITGNETNGFTFYNMAKGPNAPLGMTGSEASAYAEFVTDAAGFTTAFDFTKSKKTGADYWCVKEHGSDNNYWNRRSNRLAYWNSTDAVNGWGNSGKGDDGSALLFTEPVMMDLSTFSTEAAPKWFSVQFATGGNFLSDKGNGNKLLTAAACDSYDEFWMFEGDWFGFTMKSRMGNYVYLDGNRFKTTNTKDNATKFTFVYNASFDAWELQRIGATNTMNQVGDIKVDQELGEWNQGDKNNPFFLEEAEIVPKFPIEGIASYTPDSPLTLWYKNAASNMNASDQWMEYSLPIGNGQFGASIFGGVSREQVQFNEKTLWSGTKNDNSSEYGDYENFGSLYIQDISGVFGEDKAVKDYYRQLDLSNATASVHYKSTDGEVTYTREYIASEPDQVVAMRLKADKAGQISIKVTLASGKPGVRAKTTYSEGTATFGGKLETVTYNALAKVVNTGGTMTTDAKGITVTGADEVLIILGGATDFTNTTATYTNGTADQLPSIVAERVNKAADKDWNTLYTAHEEDYKSFFDRCNFVLDGAANNMPTDELIRQYASRSTGMEDYALMLEQLYFAYGRYLEIGSSRGVDLPSNLQGIWNNSSEPAWNCDIHANINVQMNYWPAEPTNLSEMHMPFLNYIINMANSAEWKNLAKKKGSTRDEAWTFLTENNIFGGFGSFAQNAVINNAWYVSHLWQHYRYTLDEEFLAKAFPAMWGASVFWMDRLVYNETDGTYECPNEYSPEHGPGAENATAHSQQLVWELFDNTLKAVEILNANVDADDLAILKNRFENLDKGLATEVYDGQWGTDRIANGTNILREWKTSNYTAGQNGHRHMSHLMCLYPFNQITADTELFNAAINSMMLRGDASTGWSMGWKINLWARALDGDHSHDILELALRHHSVGGGGVYYNLYDAHTPFQIDGNFGACAGIAEMLMQSHTEVINILPALPSVWQKGSISGLKAVGNFTVDIEWEDGQAQQVTIVSHKGAPLKVRSSRGAMDIAKAKITVNGVEVNATVENGIAVIPCKENDEVEIDFTTLKSMIYVVSASTGTFNNDNANSKWEKVWTFTKNEAQPASLQFTTGANNMDAEEATGNTMMIAPGGSQSSTYYLTVPFPFLIKGYSFHCDGPDNGNQKITIDGTEYPVKDGADIEVTGLSAQQTSFVLSGTNATVELTNFEVYITTDPSFKYADSFENITQWYTMKFNPTDTNNSKFVNYVSDSNGGYPGCSTNSVPTEATFYEWAFVGDLYNGFRLYNRAAGGNLALYSNGTDATTMTAEGTIFQLAVSQKTGGNYFCLKTPKENYLNVQGGRLKHYGQNDGGSTVLLGASSMMVTIGNSGYSTLYSTTALSIPEGVIAYTGALNGTGDEMTLALKPLNGTIPAATAVILKGAAGKYAFNVTSNIELTTENDLRGTAVDIATSSVTDGVVYTLQKPAGYDDVVFMEYSGTTLAANKAYLVLPAGANAISIRFEGSTDIENVEIRNEKSEMIFDLLGRRVETMTKGGIYIVNGKKVVVK